MRNANNQNYEIVGTDETQKKPRRVARKEKCCPPNVDNARPRKTCRGKSKNPTRTKNFPQEPENFPQEPENLPREITLPALPQESKKSPREIEAPATAKKTSEALLGRAWRLVHGIYQLRVAGKGSLLPALSYPLKRERSSMLGMSEFTKR